MVNLEEVREVVKRHGANQTDTENGRLSFELPWTDDGESFAAGLVFTDGLLWWSGDVRWGLLDELRPLLEG